MRRRRRTALLYWPAMPTYEYRCEQGHTFEVMQRMSDDRVSVCQVCSAPAQQVFHPIAVHFKGSGFYNTDYGTRKRSQELKEAGEGTGKYDKGDSCSSSGDGGSSSGDGGSSSDSSTGGDGGGEKSEGGGSGSGSDSSSGSGSSGDGGTSKPAAATNKAD